MASKTPTQRPVKKPAAPVKAAAPVSAPAAIEPVAAAPEAAAPVWPIDEPPAVTPEAEPAVGAPVKPVPTITAASETAATQKEDPIMATTFQNAAETATENLSNRAQTYFAETNDRAKAAWEKGQKSLEDIAAFGKGNVEALVESGKIAAKGFETLGQGAADFSRKSFEDATAAFKSFSSVKSPTELFKLQSDYVRASFDSLVAEASKSTEAMLKLAGEVAQPISNRVAVAVEKVKAAA